MNKRSIFQNIFVGLILVWLTAAVFAQTTDFTYQGKLSDGGNPANANYDMQFRLFDNPNAGQGTQQGATITNPSVTATSGVFSVQLNFGAAVFSSGADLYLELSVRPAGSNGGYTGLAPRQRIASVPYAIRSLSSLNADRLGGAAASSYLQAAGSGSALTNLNADNITAGTINDARLSPNVPKLDASQTFTGANTFNGLTLDSDSQIIAPRFENSAKEPAPASAANAGRVYFNTTTNSLMVSDGTSWQSLSPPARQIFPTPVTSTQIISCNGGTLRSASFTKNSAATRLRITYTDTPTALSTSPFGLRLNGRIDGSLITSPARLGILSDAHANFPNSFAVENTTTIVGYANGVSAGAHILSFTYEAINNSAAITCYSGVNFPSSSMIEIEEVP